MKDVAFLFARQDSNYKAMPGCDVFDIDRDARTFAGGMPVVAHPPYRMRGRLRKFAKGRPDEKALGIWAVDQVRTWGACLSIQRKARCSTTAACRTQGSSPTSSAVGSWRSSSSTGGHRAEKATWLYIVGGSPSGIPAIPRRTGKPMHCVRPTRSYPRLPSITKAGREHTPPPLAEWLVELARRTAKRRLIA